MKAKHAARARYGILAARSMFARGRLTPWQIDVIEWATTGSIMDNGLTLKAFGREADRLVRAQIAGFDDQIKAITERAA